MMPSQTLQPVEPTMQSTWTLDEMAAGIDPRTPAKPRSLEHDPRRMKPPLRAVALAKEHFAESAMAALDKAAEWIEEGFITRAYESQSGDEDDFSWVVEAYGEKDPGGFVRNPLRADQDRLDALSPRVG